MLRLRASPQDLPIGVIVADLDRTLTDRALRVVPAALDAIDAARRAGLRTVLCTGRTLRELRGRRGLLDRFDHLLLEGGALHGTVHGLEPTRPGLERFDDLVAWLEDRGIPFRRGLASLSVHRRDLRRIRRYPRFQAFTHRANHDRVDVTLHGVDKGAALRAYLREERPRGKVLAFGDAENDLPLLEAADYAVAVANADPRVRRLADAVTDAYGGRGVARFLRGRLLDGGKT